MKNLISLIAIIAFLFININPLIAQKEMPGAKKHENVQWYEVLHVKYKPGKMEDAQKLVQKHFVPVDEKIGRKVRAFAYPFGEWNMMVMFPLESPDEISYEISPAGAEWYKTFSEQEGGMDKAQQVMQQYMELVDDYKTELVMYYMHEEEISASTEKSDQ